MVCRILVNTVQLLLALRGDSDRNGDEPIVLAQGAFDRTVIQCSGVFLDQRTNYQSKFIGVLAHELYWELTWELKQCLVTHRADPLFEPEADAVTRALPDRAARIVAKRSQGFASQLVAVQADFKLRKRLTFRNGCEQHCWNIEC